MKTQEKRTINFTLAIAKTKEYGMKGMTKAQAQGKEFINGLIDEWLANYQFETIQKQVGYLREQLRETNRTLNYANQDIKKATKYNDSEWLNDLTIEIEKFTMVKKMLTEMLGAIAYM